MRLWRTLTQSSNASIKMPCSTNGEEPKSFKGISGTLSLETLTSGSQDGGCDECDLPASNRISGPSSDSSGSHQSYCTRICARMSRFLLATRELDGFSEKSPSPFAKLAFFGTKSVVLKA